MGGRRGLGLDIDQMKVREARALGFPVTEFDALDLPSMPIVRFVSMLHFLERLPTVQDAQAIIAKATDSVSDFVFIRQPFFDMDPHLSELGLVPYWSRWAGHPNMMVMADFDEVLNALLEAGSIYSASYFGLHPVTHSADTCLHALNSAPEQHHFVDGIHPPKPDIEIAFPAFREIVVLIEKRRSADWPSSIETRLNLTKIRDVGF